jgi:hypothetical protein
MGAMSLWITLIAIAAFVAVGAALWWAAVSGERPRTFEDKIKLITVAGGVLVGIGAVLSYVDTANREIKKSYAEKRLSLCIDASDSAATLADREYGAPPSNSWNMARARFETLYWGSLAIFENTDVESKYVGFRKLLVIPAQSESDVYTLRQAALAVSHACRRLVSEAWTLDLSVLKSKEEQLEQDKKAPTTKPSAAAPHA